MTIINGYATLPEFLAFKSADSLNSADDAVIEDIIEAVSRFIDRETGRTFYPRTQTRMFDVPEGRVLALDDDLLSVTSLKNGDGSTITAGEYSLVPANSPPYYAIRLKQLGTYFWSTVNGETEDVIAVAGSWGFSATTPDDIKGACLDISANVYARRSGQGTDGQATVTAAGVVIQPRDIPGMARMTLDHYKRRL